MWGGLTSLNDVLIPHLKGMFSLNYFESMLVQFCFFGAYGLMSIPAGRLVKRNRIQERDHGRSRGAALGCLMFYPAAAMRSYPCSSSRSSCSRPGIVILQVAANPYVAILGKPETASSRLTLTQAFNSLATYVFPRASFGPIILAVAGLSAVGARELLTPAARQAKEASAVQLPYVALAGLLGLLAVIVAISKLPNRHREHE